MVGTVFIGMRLEAGSSDVEIVLCCGSHYQITRWECRYVCYHLIVFHLICPSSHSEHACACVTWRDRPRSSDIPPSQPGWHQVRGKVLNSFLVLGKLLYFMRPSFQIISGFFNFLHPNWPEYLEFQSGCFTYFIVRWNISSMEWYREPQSWPGSA